MIGKNGASFEITVTLKGSPAVKVNRPGEVSMQYEFRTKEYAETWLRLQLANGTFDRANDHPLYGPRETD
jgi:hypothetical protein